MRTHKVLRKRNKKFDIYTGLYYETEANVYIVQLNEKEYCKAKRIFKEN